MASRILFEEIHISECWFTLHVKYMARVANSKENVSIRIYRSDFPVENQGKPRHLHVPKTYYEYGYICVWM